MALPRFDRLDSGERARILDVAARQLADPETAEASVVEIAAAAGLSRSAMYNYFDGRADLVQTVGAHAAELAADALGPWPGAYDAEAFWAALRAGSDRLRALLRSRPELRGLLATTGPADDDPWLAALLDDAAALGLLPAGDRRLAAAVTAAVLGAVDALELAEPGSVPDERVQALLQATWAATR